MSMMLRTATALATVTLATAQPGCSADVDTTGEVDVQDILFVLSQYGTDNCDAGLACELHQHQFEYYHDGPNGPLGDTGMLGWEVVDEDTAAGCAILNEYNPSDMISGLTMHFDQGCHDESHTLLRTRSPQFYGPVSVMMMSLGGTGSADSAGPNENAINPGFMGIAIRHVATGTYIASTNSGDTFGGTNVPVSLLEKGEHGELYTIDIIDNYSGSWGWAIWSDIRIDQGYPHHVDISFASVTPRYEAPYGVGTRPDTGEEHLGSACYSGGGCGGGAMYVDSSDLELMHDGASEQVVGIRFPSVDLPPNAAVDMAWVAFDVDEVDNQKEHLPVAIRIEGVADPDPALICPNTIATVPASERVGTEYDNCLDSDIGDLSGRIRTSAHTIWSPEATYVVHEELVTADIADIVNEITGLPYWQQGNPMMIIFSYIHGSGGVRWVESSRMNAAGTMYTPALVWAYDPCAGSYPEPCIDDQYGILAADGYGCPGIVGGNWHSVDPAIVCNTDPVIGWEICPWMNGAFNGDGVADHHCVLAVDMCPVSCGTCSETPHDMVVADTLWAYQECIPQVDAVAFTQWCCNADPYLQSGGNCDHLLSVDLDGSSSYYHGVPSDFETACSVECSWHIVEMWESCGDILYYDSVSHGINPPSDPSDMATFYETCLPVYQGNPPPPPPPNLFGDGAAADIITSANSDRSSGGEEDANTGTMYLGSSDLELPFDGDTQQIIAVVFQGVDADANTGVTEATILFDVDEVRVASAEDVTMSIYGELNASPSLPSLNDNDISSRAATTASVEWSPPASQIVHEDLVTPDIVEIVNEIFALPGWSAGSDMCIMFSWISGTGSRWVESASTNNGIDTPALLLTQPGMSCGGGTILTSANGDRSSGGEQDVESGTMYLGSSDLELMHDGVEQIVAIVFQGVEADASTGVTEATILFDIDEVNAESADPVSINIYGELNASPALPSLTDNDLSSRAQTEATVEWSPPPSNVVHEELMTPNIVSIVDEIFALPDWSGGNDMCIMFSHISGSGVRWVENASTNNGIDTPALLLSYV